MAQLYMVTDKNQISDYISYIQSQMLSTASSAGSYACGDTSGGGTQSLFQAFRAMCQRNRKQTPNTPVEYLGKFCGTEESLSAY